MEIIDLNRLVIQLFISGSFGFLIFLSQGLLIHRYFLQKNLILTSIFLPSLTSAITIAISSNLFLSLGMIGALSIVRYRTPVKSIYDLSILFSLITIGIVTGVSIYASTILVIFIFLVTIVFYIFFKLKIASFFDIRIEQHEKIWSVSADFKPSIDLSQIDESYHRYISSISENIDESSNHNFINLDFNDYDKAYEFYSIIKKNKNLKSITIS